MMDIKQLAEAEAERLTALRRHFHAHPELSQKEFATMDFIEKELAALGVPTVRVPHGGVFGFLDSGKPGWTVLMRADIDALPIQESERNLARAKACVSENPGVSHACGHDGHMAMLLTEAKILAEHREDWAGKVVLMFEEAEEMGERGIAPMLRWLAAHEVPVDVCWGSHVMYNVPVGKIALMDGAMLAGAFFFRVKVHGKSGHGSMPHLAVSPIDCFTAFASALQSYRMRRIRPDTSFTYSFGMVQAGDTPNVIPDELTFAGTARYLDNESGEAFRRDFWKLLHDVCAETGCTAEAVEDQFFPATVNTKECAEFGRRAIGEVLGPDAVISMPPWMAAETFSLTELTYPGVFAFTGIQDEATGSGANHHTPEFDIDERGLVCGVEAALAYVLAMLREKPSFPSFRKKELEPMLELTEIRPPRQV